MTIVYAIAVLGVLAIVFGLILAVAAKVFGAFPMQQDPPGDRTAA